MKRMSIILLLVLALCLAAFAGASAEESIYGHLGETLPDFSVSTIDGETFTLSEALAEKDMVLINLWASWCPPCEMEFPYLQEAYELYQDRVEVIALSIEPNDTNSVLREYAAAHGMTFKVANEGSLGLGARFATIGIPTTLAIDRFGVVAFIEVGAQTTTSAFMRIFEAFVGDGYTESRIYVELPPLAPSVTPADEAALNEALNVEGGELAFRNSSDKYVWPMLPAEGTGGLALASSNQGQADSAAAVLTSVSAAAGDVLAFDFYTSSEAAADLLSVGVDGETVKSFGGEHSWTSWAVALSEGEHEIAFHYTKDSDADEGSDTAMIDNVRLVSGEEAARLLDALPVYPTADEITFELMNEDAREIVFDDPQNALTEYFYCRSYWIVPSAKAEARLAVTADIEPEASFFYSNYDYALTVLSDAMSGDGYYVASDIDSMDTTGQMYTNLYFYPHIKPENAEDVYGLMLFVDEENVNELVNALEKYGVELGWRYADESAPSTSGEYIVRFVDQDGNPVPGCIVNFCTDEACMPVTADENGVAAFSGEPYAYHLQVLKVPVGYGFDMSREFYTEPEGGEMTLVLTKN